MEDIQAHVDGTPQVAALSRARFLAHIRRYVPAASKADARRFWNSSKFKRVRLLFRRTLARLRKPRPDKIEPAIVANPGVYQIDVLYMDTEGAFDDDGRTALSRRMALAMVEVYSRRAYMVPITGRSIDADILPAYKQLLEQVKQHHEDMERKREEAAVDLMYHETSDRPVQGADRLPSFPPLPVSVILGIEGDWEFEPLRSWNDDHEIMTNIFVSKWLHNAQLQGGDSLGIVDSFARTIKHMVRTYALTHRDTQWKSYLPKLVALYNDSPHSGIHELTPDFVSLHPMVMWRDVVAKAAHNDKVEALLADDRGVRPEERHHLREDVEAIQGIRRRYDYKLPGPLVVGDFVMVLKDRASILTKGPRRNKYQVYVVHTVVRRNRYLVVKLSAIRDRGLALTDATWPDSVDPVGRVYPREELYKLTDEDKVNVDDGTVEQDLGQAVEDYRDARVDTMDGIHDSDTIQPVSDDDDDDTMNGIHHDDDDTMNGIQAARWGGAVPEKYAGDLREQADKLQEEGVVSRAALEQERKRLLQLHPIRVRSGQNRADNLARAFALDKDAFFRRLAVADAVRALGYRAGTGKTGDYMFGHIARERKHMVSALATLADQGTPEPDVPLPDHAEVRMAVEHVYDIGALVVENWERQGTHGWHLSLRGFDETLDVTDEQIKAHGSAELNRVTLGAGGAAPDAPAPTGGGPDGPIGRRLGPTVRIMYYKEGRRLKWKLGAGSADFFDDPFPSYLTPFHKAYVFKGLGTTRVPSSLDKEVALSYHDEHFDESSKTLVMWAYPPPIAVTPTEWKVTLGLVGQPFTRDAYVIDPTQQPDLADKAGTGRRTVVFDREADIRRFFPPSVVDGMLEAYRKVAAMTAAEQDVLAARLGATGLERHMRQLNKDDQGELFLELAAMWPRRERNEGVGASGQFHKVRQKLKKFFTQDWGAFPEVDHNQAKQYVSVAQRQQNLVEAGGVRATFARVVEENKDKSEEELEAAFKDARFRLATEFNWRNPGKNSGTTMDNLLNNTAARALVVEWYALGAMVHTVGRRPASFFEKLKPTRKKLEGEWQGPTEPGWRFDGYFETELNAHARFPEPFREAVRTLYDREGFDERSPTPSAAELHAWAESATEKMREHFDFPSAPKGGRSARALRGYLQIQVLWRAWFARRQASEWDDDADRELAAWKTATLRKKYNAAASKYVDNRNMSANREAALALGEEDVWG